MFDAFDAALAARARHADPGIRRVAMIALAEQPEPQATALLIAGLRDSDDAVRAEAARGLGDHEGTDAALALVDALDDPSQAVRAGVAAVTALTDTAPEVRLQAVCVLGYLRDAANVPVLARLATDPSADVRRAVMAALVRNAEAVPALLGGLADADWQVR